MFEGIVERIMETLVMSENERMENRNIPENDHLERDRRKSTREIIQHIIGAGNNNAGWHGQGNVNVYPSNNRIGCCQRAFFFSMPEYFSRPNAPVNGRIAFMNALESFVIHMQGTCVGITTEAVIITTEWNTEIYRRWEANVEQVKNTNGNVVEIYFINGRKSLRVL